MLKRAMVLYLLLCTLKLGHLLLIMMVTDYINELKKRKDKRVASDKQYLTPNF